MNQFWHLRKFAIIRSWPNGSYLRRRFPDWGEKSCSALIASWSIFSQQRWARYKKSQKSTLWKLWKIRDRCILHDYFQCFITINLVIVHREQVIISVKNMKLMIRYMEWLRTTFFSLTQQIIKARNQPSVLAPYMELVCAPVLANLGGASFRYYDGERRLSVKLFQQAIRCENSNISIKLCFSQTESSTDLEYPLEDH